MLNNMFKFRHIKPPGLRPSQASLLIKCGPFILLLLAFAAFLGEPSFDTFSCIIVCIYFSSSV